MTVTEARIALKKLAGSIRDDMSAAAAEAAQFWVDEPNSVMVAQACAIEVALIAGGALPIVQDVRQRASRKRRGKFAPSGGSARETPMDEGTLKTLKLVLTVDYELNGTSPIELVHILEQLPVIAASNFMLTGNTTSLVAEWRASVSVGS